MEHELIKTKKALQKAIDGNHITAALEVMTELARFKVTQDLLKKTDIGRVLGRLRSHQDVKVSQRAKGIVKKWKEDMTSHTKTPPSVSSSPSPSPNTPQTPLANNKPRTMKADDVVFATTGVTVRDKTVELMYNGLARDNFSDSDLLLRRAKEIEVVIYNTHGAVNDGYKGKVRSLSSNLRTNPGLRESAVSGELGIKKLCTMSVQDMASEESKARDRQLADEALFKARGAESAHAETDMFVCGKCKQRKCTYFQMQTRSADEPMTTFVTCVNCGNRWKFC
ncbi:transcription elongation factor S-II [Hesseltinella vesiculosa]|uniref:Transcription elongation factor n=1 Tax=Hesseltinella vesiculosa TaxID=101127 RepID=A0A1X2GRU2_9FUNG|nr:transcription elongation factor S-II [Hesseltinella vesiculosa]